MWLLYLQYLGHPLYCLDLPSKASADFAWRAFEGLLVGVSQLSLCLSESNSFGHEHRNSSHFPAFLSGRRPGYLLELGGGPKWEEHFA